MQNKIKVGNVLKNLDFHGDMSYLKDEERKYPKDQYQWKMTHSEESDDNQMERIIKRWRTREKRRYGIGDAGGGWRYRDGVRTEACGWFELRHVCVQPLLFAASWMSIKRWLPLPPGPFCLGPGRCALSHPAEFLGDVSFFFPGCYLHQKLPF